MSESIYEMTAELRGGFPDIPLPSDINIQDFGDNPMFVTLPIMPKGARSRNGRTYPAEAVESIVRQVNEKRPTGRWGHLADHERATRFEPPAVRWLAAVIDEHGMAWGKLVPETEQAKAYFASAKRTNAKVGTSIYGQAQQASGSITDIMLESIDLADPARVGIPESVASPGVTSEMQQEEDMEQVAELTSQRDSLQEQVSQRDARIAELGKDAAVVAELRSLFGDRDILTVVKEMAESELKARRETLALQIGEAVAEQVPLEPLRAYVSELVAGAADLDSAKAKIEDIKAGATYATLAKALVVQEQGPAAIVAPKQEGDEREEFLKRVVEQGTKKAKERGHA